MSAARPRIEEYQRAAELRAALRSFLRASEKTARRHKLTPQRFTLLLMIKGAADGSQRSTVTELSRRLQLAQSSITELVRRAEGVGLIQREQSPQDRRVVFLQLTPEGEDRLARVLTDLGPEHRRLASVLAEHADGDAG